MLKHRYCVAHTLTGRYNGRIVKESAIWVFHSVGAQFSGGVFSTLELAEAWIRLSPPVWEFIFADDSYMFVANGDFDDFDLVVAKMAEMLRTMFVPPVRRI